LVGVLEDRDLGEFDAETNVCLVVSVLLRCCFSLHDDEGVRGCALFFFFEGCAYRSATSFASSGWLLPVSSLMELVAMLWTSDGALACVVLDVVGG